MKLRMYIRTWQGVDLTSLPSASSLPPNQIAGPLIYEEFYQVWRRTRPKEDTRWLAGKRYNGQVLLEKIIRPWEQEQGRPPAILSLGAGRGITESVWLQEGYKVTLQDVQPYSFEDIKKQFPHANFIVGDVRNLLLWQRFDMIFMLGLDYLMTDDELVAVFRQVRNFLEEQGILINQTMNALSVRRFLVYILKRGMGVYKRQKHIFWGYYRSPGEINKRAREAGYRICKQYYYTRSNNVLKKRPAFMFDLPTATSDNVITVYSPTNC